MVLLLLLGETAARSEWCLIPRGFLYDSCIMLENNVVGTAKYHD